MSPTTDTAYTPFVDRRAGFAGEPPTVGERRQFANSHGELSPAARELALAIDAYKFRHRRRFISYEEMLSIVLALGYNKDETPNAPPLDLSLTDSH